MLCECPLFTKPFLERLFAPQVQQVQVHRRWRGALPRRLAADTATGNSDPAPPVAAVKAGDEDGMRVAFAAASSGSTLRAAAR